jgi:hypothetical protein
LPREKALDFWREVLQGVTRGERVLLMARDTVGQLVGTVQLITEQPDNQPHRADVAKMLVLDTVTNEAGWRLYQRCGWQIAGEVPDYALLPRGGLVSTTFMYKEVSALA